MPYKIIYTEPYKRRLERFLRKHLKVFNQSSKTIEILKANPHHPSLRLHKPKRDLQEFHSVSINIKYHITIEFIIQDKMIIPVMIGSHDETYR